MRKHITTALILLLCACGVREISIDGLDEYKMDTVGTIRLAEEIDIEDLLTVGKNYIVLDSFNDKYEIKIFDEKGSILFRYGKKGKGPGEFSESDLILAGIHNGRLYVADSDVNKIVAFKMDGDSSFAFEDEFFIDSGSMIRGGMTGAGEMAFSLVQDDHMLKTFNTDGVKTAEYIPIEIPDINKMSRRELLTFLRSNLFFPVCNGDNMMLFYFLDRKMRFLTFEGKAIKNISDVDYPVVEKTLYESRGSRKDGNTSVNISFKGTYAGFVREGAYWTALIAEEDRGGGAMVIFNAQGQATGYCTLEFPPGEYSPYLMYDKENDTVLYQLNDIKTGEGDRKAVYVAKIRRADGVSE